MDGDSISENVSLSQAKANWKKLSACEVLRQCEREMNYLVDKLDK